MGDDIRGTRRGVLTLLVAGPWPAMGWAATQATSDNQALGLLRAGGCVVLLRHAATVPGVGDPPDFKLGVCGTQRNLSDTGRLDARRIGTWFASRKLKPRAVLSSAWCRCKDTADLAFGAHVVWPALNSTFNDRSRQADQSALVKQAMARIPKGQFEAWVTHQVNITAVTDQNVGMGEGMLVDQGATLRGRLGFE